MVLEIVNDSGDPSDPRFRLYDPSAQHYVAGYWPTEQSARSARAVIEAEAATSEMSLTALEQRVFDALWEISQDHRLEALTPAGARYAVTGDIIRQMARATVRTSRESKQ